MIGQAGSERLMVGTTLGATFEFRALQAIKPDVEQKDWTLLNIMDFSPDRPSTNLARTGDAVEDPAVTISFQKDYISGSAGCNSYEASLNLVDDVVSIGPPSVSELSCDDLENARDVMKQELRYLSILPQVKRIGTYDDTLFMSTEGYIYLLFKAE